MDRPDFVRARWARVESGPATDWVVWAPPLRCSPAGRSVGNLAHSSDAGTRRSCWRSVAVAAAVGSAAVAVADSG